MIRFVNLLNTRDVRWILDVQELPDNYQGEDLKPIIEQLMIEDEKLSGNNYYTSFIEDEDYKLKEESKIIAYTTFQMCLSNGLIEESEKIKTAWKFKIKTWEDANNKVLNLQQKLKTHEFKNKKENKETTQLNYGAMIANLVYFLKITPYDMTVAQFRAHELQVKQLNTKK